MTTAATTDLAACLALVSEATPGPWHLCEDGFAKIGAFSCPTVYATDTDLRYIAFCNDRLFVGEATNNLANARMIPAAANLLRTHGPTLQRALALLAAVESGKAFGTWQPIETAPKDGRLFLCWVAAERWSAEDGGGSGRGADTSDHDFGRWKSMDDHPEGGYYENMMGQIGDAQDITHWMPLLAAPAAPGVECPHRTRCDCLGACKYGFAGNGATTGTGVGS